MRIVSVGEVLWDVFGTREILGGAPLNFSVNAHRLENSVLLVSAVGDDERGERAIAQMRALGLKTDLVPVISDRPTGTAIVKTDAAGNANYEIPRPAAFDFVWTDEQIRDRIREFRPEWIYFGSLAQTNPKSATLLSEMIEDSNGVQCFYDINLREGHWSLDLVQRLSHAASVIKLNDAEAKLLFELTRNGSAFRLEEFCSYWSSTFGVRTICVTLGEDGCAIFEGSTLRRFAGYPIEVVDTVGAGDAFAAGFLHGCQQGWPMERVAAFANTLGAMVASRPGATPAWTLADLQAITSAAN